MPTARADEADNVNVSGKSNTERDFTSLWAHLKISAGPGSGRRQSAASTSWESLCFYFLFSPFPFSAPHLPSLSIYEF